MFSNIFSFVGLCFFQSLQVYCLKLEDAPRGVSTW